MTTFPSLRPTNREFIAGRYPIAKPEFQSTIRYARLTGTQPIDAKLLLDFTNILDEEAAQIMTCYAQTLGGYLPVTLPSEVFSGTKSKILIDRIQGNTGLKWHFEEAPTQESVFSGISTVRVRLKGILVGQ
jgi:hypothetical protein